MHNSIPPITDPMGRVWTQPPLSAVIIDDTHALMTKRTFDDLAEYSHSFPSGVYPGKMWKSHLRDSTWVLRWYDEHTDPKMCASHLRDILIV